MRADDAYSYVAAGGGSICRFDGSRLRVGPESAGANPGPVCYRLDGPLTVTDCNVMLGRLPADFFPKIFGPTGDLPIDVDLVRQRFKELVSEIGELSPERLASGFLRIAVENVANAIKKISVARGYDVSRYTLVTFGGAGGQHACAVADALGMERVLIHRFAGVLSAYGMGLAELRVLKECSVEKSLTRSGIEGAERVLAELEAEARAELLAQGSEIETIVRKFNLRYEGTNTPLAVDAGSAEEMKEAFLEAHRTRFGFVMSSRGQQVVIDSVSLEAIGQGDTHSGDFQQADKTSEPEPFTFVDAVFEEHWHSTPVFERASMGCGSRINGPAIIVESTTTTVVETGWKAEITAGLDLLLSRAVPRPGRFAVGTTVDPMLLELFNNMFMSIAEQMGAVLQNSAYSVNIKERLDFSCAVFDGDGKLVANAPHVPVHLGSMGEAVRAIIRRRGAEIRSGEVYALNDPFAGGTHLPDVTVVTPVFGHLPRPLFWVASRGHHADIGGLTPGSMPPESRTIEEEGVMITDFLLVEQRCHPRSRVPDLAWRGAISSSKSSSESGRYPGPDRRKRERHSRIKFHDRPFRFGGRPGIHGSRPSQCI